MRRALKPSPTPPATILLTALAVVADQGADDDHHPVKSAKPGPRTKKNSGVPFDPIKENGRFFEGWPKPKLALVITGRLEGYLEPCGCAGLDRMTGGLGRRYSLFSELRDKRGWPVVGLDVGGNAKGVGKQAELKLQFAFDAMRKMHYDAVTLGGSDLRLPAAELAGLTAQAGPGQKSMFVCGNVGLSALNDVLLPRIRCVSAGSETIGVTAVLGKAEMAQLADMANLKLLPAETSLSEIVPQLKKRANYLVLLAHATRDEAVDLAKKYPDFDLVVCSGGAAAPPGNYMVCAPPPPGNYREIRQGGTKLVETGEKGQYAVVLGMFDDRRQPFRYQRVTLDSRFPSAPEMEALMAGYQSKLEKLGLDGLGIPPAPNPLNKSNGNYVGSEVCKNCHDESYRVWKETPHSRGLSTLKNLKVPRAFDPECISCHAVGWHPTKFYPYQSGYLSEQETPRLNSAGCEDCHGPGELHVKAENHGTPAEQDTYRKAVRLTEKEAADPKSPKQNCWTCHDLDNSPEFKFPLYFPYVKHYENE